MSDDTLLLVRLANQQDPVGQGKRRHAVNERRG